MRRTGIAESKLRHVISSRGARENPRVGCDWNTTYSLIYNAEQGGVIEGNVNQSVHKGESGTEVSV